MKIDGRLLTLSAFLPTTTTAFGSQFTALFKGLNTPDAQSPSSSYLGNLGGSEGSSSVADFATSTFSDVLTSRYTVDKDASKTKATGDLSDYYFAKSMVNGDVSAKSDYTVR